MQSTLNPERFARFFAVRTLQAQLWLKDKVASAIVRCPQKATVVFDNVQALQGQDLLLLDPLLLLFDGNK